MSDDRVVDPFSIRANIDEQILAIFASLDEMGRQIERIRLARYRSWQKPQKQRFRKYVTELRKEVEKLERNAFLLHHDGITRWIERNKSKLLNVYDIKSDIDVLELSIKDLKQERKRLESTVESTPMLPGGVALMPGQYEAFKIIRQLIRMVKRRFYLVDPYIDETVFDDYLDRLPPRVEIRMLSNRLEGGVLARAKKFKTKNPRFEVKRSNQIHDRYIVADDRAWMLGPSLKDAGKKAWVIAEFEDTFPIETLVNILWTGAVPPA